MPRSRALPRRAGVAALVLLGLAGLAGVAGCGDETAVPARDSTVPVVVPPESAGVVPVAAAGWDSTAAGIALFVVGSEDGGLAIVFPDVTDSTFQSATLPVASLGGTKVELFARAGRIGTVQLTAAGGIAPGEERDGCVAWPMARLAGAAPSGALVGIAEGKAQAIPLDSIERMSRADSAQLAADVARLASTIPNDTAVAFAGLPFFVRSAYRFRPAAGVDALLADVVRRIGQEADPREQHILLVAERDPAGRYQLAYHARTSGAEDQVETREPLAALLLGPARRPVLLLGLTYYEGSAYMLVERRPDGTWRERWTSAYSGC